MVYLFTVSKSPFSAALINSNALFSRKCFWKKKKKRNTSKVCQTVSKMAAVTLRNDLLFYSTIS
jgi:hypothetical protein